jgi:hypothetical protein
VVSSLLLLAGLLAVRYWPQRVVYGARYIGPRQDRYYYYVHPTFDRSGKKTGLAEVVSALIHYAQHGRYIDLDPRDDEHFPRWTGMASDDGMLHEIELWPP